MASERASDEDVQAEFRREQASAAQWRDADPVRDMVTVRRYSPEGPVGADPGSRPVSLAEFAQSLRETLAVTSADDGSFVPVPVTQVSALAEILAEFAVRLAPGQAGSAAPGDELGLELYRLRDALRSIPVTPGKEHWGSL